MIPPLSLYDLPPVLGGLERPGSFLGQGSSCVTLVVPLLFPKMVVPQNHPKLVIICYYQWENQWFEVPILSETSI